jgi:hypothetical protein
MPASRCHRCQNPTAPGDLRHSPTYAGMVCPTCLRYGNPVGASTSAGPATQTPQFDPWFLRAVSLLRNTAPDYMPERLREFRARLDDLVQMEAAYLQGDESVIPQAAALLPLVEPSWVWTGTHEVSAVYDLMASCAVLQAARHTRRREAVAARHARQSRYPAYRPHRDLCNASCAACDALLYAHVGTTYCWDCTQRYDPLTCAAVDAARATIDAHWQARDADALIAYLQAQAGYHIEASAAGAIRAAVEAQDAHVYRILRLLAEWYAGRAAYAGLADPKSLLRIRPIPAALAGIYPLNLIVGHYADRAEALARQREVARRRRGLGREWERLARLEAGITYVPHPDILEVGLEIECGADVAYVPRDVDRGFDGSVYVDPSDDNHDDWQADLELRFRFRAAEWPDWSARIRALWRLAHVRQNRTCGNHVHVSLTERALDAIARPEFLRWFHARYVEEHCGDGDDKYAARLDNRYCRWDCPSADEIRARMREHGAHTPGSTRYRAVNWHAYYEHGTVEFRILPHAGDGVEYALSVTWLLRMLSEYLQSSLSDTEVTDEGWRVQRT